MLTKEELPPCPVATTLMLIGNKWKIFIIQQLMDRPSRFGELRRAIPGISEKVLTDNLRAMEKDGIITRAVFPEVPPRSECAPPSRRSTPPPRRASNNPARKRLGASQRPTKKGPRHMPRTFSFSLRFPCSQA